MLGIAGLVGLLAGMGGGGEHAGAEPIELRLVLIDLVGVSPQVRTGMVEEAQRLLQPRGVSLSVRTGNPADQREAAELGIVLLPERSRGRSRGGLRLGSVGRTAGVTTVWIDVAAVAAVADAGRGLHCCHLEMRRLALALGRVLTHELVHVLAPQQRHTRGGLMAARVGRATLVDDPAPEPGLEIAKRLN